MRVHNEMPPSAIAPLPATTTWGTPSSSYWQVHGSVNVGDTTHTVPVNVTAPTTAGTYYIVAALAGTYNSAQIMSGTHPGWTADWVNKVALLPAATIESGMVNEWIPFECYTPNGPAAGQLALNAVRVVVSGSSTNQPPVPRIAVGPLAEFPGLDRNLIIAANGHNALVTLDGSQTTDPENDPLSFAWYDRANLLGNNVTTTALLAVEAHTITLQVKDGVNTVAVEADVEVITLAQAVEVITSCWTKRR